MPNPQESERDEAKRLIAYMNKIADVTPRGLSDLSDTLTMATMDLCMFFGQGFKNKDYPKAIAFARSIPEFTDFDSDEFNSWLLNDRAFIQYLS